VIGTFINEGIAMLPRASRRRRSSRRPRRPGYPAPVLQLSDELNLKLMRKIRKAAAAAAGDGSGWDAHPSEA
jgi:3-hydroxyacyl-CoA dehydrogenase/enoyl-CoA hydratase/3-hydroxybutyryl-CoA epimerase